MKRHSGIFYILLMCIIAFSASMAGYVSGVRATGQKMRRQSSLSAPSPFMQSRTALPIEDTLPIISAESSITTTYILRDKDGKLALFSKFSDGEESLYQDYDILTKSLPKSDRELLSAGIEVSSLSDALQLVEDYSS